MSLQVQAETYKWIIMVVLKHHHTYNKLLLLQQSSKLVGLVIGRPVMFNINLIQQDCPTCGPGAACGPLAHFMRPQGPPQKFAQVAKIIIAIC